MLQNSKEQVHFWRELERAERWLSTGAGAAVGRIYDTMGRPGAQAFAGYGSQLAAAGARVDRVREALDQSGPMAKRLVMQQLSGVGLSAVWDILIAACKEIALYYGGSVVAGAVVGGAIGSLALGVGAVPGAVVGTAAGSQIGMWVLALLGLKELAEGLGNMFPAAMQHYERGFREAWGPAPDHRRDTWNSSAQPSGNASIGAWHMAQGHVILVTAILTALVAYLTRGRGNKALLMQQIRESRRLGPKFADWVVENERRLIAQPQLQSRPNNSVVMAAGDSLPSGGRTETAVKSGIATGAVGTNSSESNIVYRALTPADKASIEAGTGIAAKAPDGTWTAAEHVANAGPGAGGAASNSPWISTTRLLDVAKEYEGGNGIVGIDLSKVESFHTEVWQTAPRVNGVAGLPYHRSIWAQEVTIYQEIPQNAIIRIPETK
ncbi:DUF6861 domain-containing protein [Massilia sp. METH4]|uniref:DUF6861 domain-containing protein n=1 Tax=Massilia sp. METH4 TaxID=3123041 RepID=UPI0030D36B16